MRKSGVARYADLKIKRSARGLTKAEAVRFYWQSDPERAIELVKTQVNKLIRNIKEGCGHDLDLCKHEFCRAYTISGLQRAAEKFVEVLKACYGFIRSKMGEVIARTKVANLLKNILYMLNLDINPSFA